MVPADSADINQEYQILLNEIKQYNPELLDKQRLVAITKCDLLDQELQEEMTEQLTLPVPYIFISSLANIGLTALRDLLWKALQ